MRLSYSITIIDSYLTAVEVRTAVGEMSGKVTRTEITKNHWINRDKEMERGRGLREMEEGEKKKWKAMVGGEEVGDKNKGKGSGEGRG